ncbi:MAG: hypothetical protein QXI49_07670 [Candidatus Methanomethylicaceae archaeon]
MPDFQFGFSIIPRTALKPNQSAYFATTSFQVPPNSSALIKIGLGFSIKNGYQLEKNLAFGMFHLLLMIIAC